MGEIDAMKPDLILTAEDGVLSGGFSHSVAMLLKTEGNTTHFTAVGVPEEPVEHGSVDELYKMLGMDGEGIAQRIISCMERGFS